MAQKRIIVIGIICFLGIVQFCTADCPAHGCAGVRTAFKSVRGKVTRGSLNIAKLAVFWAGVFIAARYILESN